MEELLHTYTADGLLLEGVRHGPRPIDIAIVYTHGVTSSVFRKTHVLIGRSLSDAGWTVIAGNNRGAALAYPLLHRSGTRVLGGAWFERLEDAAIDIDAWIDAALAAGAKRIVLFGHSLGALTCFEVTRQLRSSLWPDSSSRPRRFVRSRRHRVRICSPPRQRPSRKARRRICSSFRRLGSPSVA